MPERIRMSRQHPWRADHPDAVIVDRRTPWGNVFRVQRDPKGGWNVIGMRIPVQWWWAASKEHATRSAVDAFRRSITPDMLAQIRAELAGKTLACWCPLVDEHGNRVPCHADVLLELANPGWKP